MEKASAAALKQMKEDYEKKVLMVQKQFEKDKKKLEEEVGQEKVKVEETKKEQAANVTKAQNALGKSLQPPRVPHKKWGMGNRLPGRRVRLVPASWRHVRARLCMAAM